MLYGPCGYSQNPLFVLIRTQAATPSKAAVICRSICRLLALTDAAEKLTPEAIPAAAAALKGKERDGSEARDNGVLEGEHSRCIANNVQIM